VLLSFVQARNINKDLDQSDYFEGDIVLTNDQSAALLSKNGILPNQRWPRSSRGIVNIPYHTDEKWTSVHKALLADALKEIEDNTCIRFVQSNKPTPNSIKVINDTGCYSYVGKIGGEQVLSLLDTAGYGPHCWFHKTIVHEFMHAIGLWHEQSRYDRDDFIVVHLENVDASKRHNFNKVTEKQSSVYGIKYNYESVMHYTKGSFSNNGKDTIETKDPAYQNVIGNVKEGHPQDYEKNPKNL